METRKKYGLVVETRKNQKEVWSGCGNLAYLAMMPIENQSFLVLLRILQSMWEYVNNAFWDIAMARCENDKEFIEEEDCDWP